MDRYDDINILDRIELTARTLEAAAQRLEDEHAYTALNSARWGVDLAVVHLRKEAAMVMSLLDMDDKEIW